MVFIKFFSQLGEAFFLNICLRTVQQCNSLNCKLNIEFFLCPNFGKVVKPFGAKFKLFIQYSKYYSTVIYIFFAFFAHRMNVTLVNYTMKGGSGINRNKARWFFFIHFMLSLKRLWVPQTEWGGAEGQWRQTTKAWVSNNKEQVCRDFNQNTAEIFEIPPLLS